MIADAPLAAGCRLPDTLLRQLGWPAPDSRAAVVLFVRGAWCPVCRRQITRFAARADELAALGVPLYVVSTADSATYTADPRLSALPVSYVADIGGEIISALGIAAEHPDHGVIARPTTVIVDSDGAIRYAHVGTHARDRPEPNAIVLAIRHVFGID